MPDLSKILKPLLVILVVYVVAFWLSLSYWAFRDARERSTSIFFHMFATAISLLLPIFGLFIYLMVRPSLTMAERRALELETQALSEAPEGIVQQRACPSCGQTIDTDYVLCPYCHTQFGKRCTRCSRVLRLGWTVCPFCGEEHLLAPPPAAPPARLLGDSHTR
jgi:RNA polymerase subunit RPABC4/transcription elongation factor Spt4